MSRWMPDCREVHRLVMSEQDRRLTAAERLRTRVHVAMCAGCGNLSRQLKIILDAMRRFPGPDDD